MGLIKNILEPKQNMEYLYLMEMIWLDESLHPQTKVERYTVMVNVVKNDDESFSFQSKETGVKYRTNYGWALAENTPENLERIRLSDEQDKIYSEHKRKAKKLRNEVITLG